MYNSDCIHISSIKNGLKNINVIFIVLDVGAATVTKENREVRNFKVGDPTACINVSIWDDPGKMIAPGDIIKLTKGYASIWRHCLTLYSGKNGEVYKIGEFCMTFNEMVNMSEPKRPDQQSTTTPGGVGNSLQAPQLTTVVAAGTALPTSQSQQQQLASGASAGGNGGIGNGSVLTGTVPVSGGNGQRNTINLSNVSAGSKTQLTNINVANTTGGAAVTGGSTAQPQSVKVNRTGRNVTRASNLKTDRR